MKTLETNDWIILNTIIYKVYTMEDFDEMRKELLEQLKLLVDFDSADFYLASVEDEKKLDRPVMYNCDSNLSEEYEELDYSRGIMLSGKSLIYRETDIISDESRVEMEYYKKVYKLALFAAGCDRKRSSFPRYNYVLSHHWKGKF